MPTLEYFSIQNFNHKSTGSPDYLVVAGGSVGSVTSLSNMMEEIRHFTFNMCCLSDKLILNKIPPCPNPLLLVLSAFPFPFPSPFPHSTPLPFPSPLDSLLFPSPLPSSTPSSLPPFSLHSSFLPSSIPFPLPADLEVCSLRGGLCQPADHAERGVPPAM